MHHLLPVLPFETEVRRYRLIGEGNAAFWYCSQSDENAPLPPSPVGLDNPPLELFIQGKRSAFELLRELPVRGFSIVGTRHPQPRSVELVRKRISGLRRQRL